MMNKTLKKVLLGAGFTAASLVALTSTSWSMNHGGLMGHDPERLLEHMADHLDLTSEQREEVAGLLQAAKEATAADRQRLKQLHMALRDQGADFDIVQTREVADEVGQITASLVFEAARTHSSVQAVLTPEQRDEMLRMMDKRAERRGKWHRSRDADGL